MATKKVALKQAVKKAPAKKTAAKKSAVKKPKTNNLDRLVAADVIPQESVSEHDPKVINKLSAAEVSTLIKLRKKLGDAPFATKASTRPNFPV